MTKSEDIMKSLDDEELQILLLCFSKPNVLEALRIYNKIPGHGKQAFFNAGKRELNRRGWTVGRRDGWLERYLLPEQEAI